MQYWVQYNAQHTFNKINTTTFSLSFFMNIFFNKTNQKNQKGKTIKVTGSEQVSSRIKILANFGHMLHIIKCWNFFFPGNELYVHKFLSYQFSVAEFLMQSEFLFSTCIQVLKMPQSLVICFLPGTPMLTHQSLSITTMFALVIIGQIVLQLNLLEDSSFPSVSTMLPFKLDQLLTIEISLALWLNFQRDHFSVELSEEDALQKPDY